jgi:uncharacterized protein (TIGR02001 family)
MRKTIIAAALAATFAAPMAAFAEDAAPEVPALTFNVGVVSDYVFRGITQTRGLGALQAGADYAHESGLYVGTWVSNVNWVRDGGYTKDNNYEVDLYGGYKFDLQGIGMDVGVIRYQYPLQNGGEIASTTRTPNTTEVYIGGTYQELLVKYNYTVSPDFIGWVPPDASLYSRGSNYLDLTLTHPMTEKVNLVMHAGRQVVKNLEAASYTDWKLGVTWDVGFGVAGLAATGSNAKFENDDDPYGKAGWSGNAIAGTRVAASFLKTF